MSLRAEGRSVPSPAAGLAPFDKRLKQRLLETIFDSSSWGIGICDTNLRIVFVNTAWAAMDGVPVASHIGKRVTEVLRVDACPVEGVMRQVISSGQPIYGLGFAAKIPARTEVTRWLLNLFPLKDETGQVTHVGSVTIDTTPKMGFASFLVASGQSRREVAPRADTPLSPREIEITQLLAEGKSNKEIAQILIRSVKTVETHRLRITRTLGIHSMAELVRYAIRNGLVKP
jgi:PAS domain S-box-containing protein